MFKIIVRGKIKYYESTKYFLQSYRRFNELYEYFIKNGMNHHKPVQCFQLTNLNPITWSPLTMIKDQQTSIISFELKA